MMLVTDTLFDTNGVSRFIRDLASRAEGFGTELTVVTASPLAPERLPGNILNLKPPLALRMPFYKEQYLTVIPPLFRLYRIMRKTRPQIIHLSTPGPMGWSALLCARLLGIPCAATYHTHFPAFLEENTRSHLIGNAATLVMRRFYRRMAFVFSRSKGFIPLLTGTIGTKAVNTFYLPPGTDTETFSPEKRPEGGFWNRYGIGDNSMVLLYVGRLNVEKNLLFLIERFKELRSSIKTDICLVLVGEGEYARHAPSWREESIFYLGVKRGEELSKIYAASDLFVSASITETLGQTVMEAQASGIPAIVSDQGGVIETVVDQHTGFTISVTHPERWVAAMVKLVRDKELREEMGDAARQRMRKASIAESCRAFLQKHKEFSTR